MQGFWHGASVNTVQAHAGLRILVGIVMAIGGAATIVFFTFVAYGRGPFLDGVAFALGLAGLLLLAISLVI